MVICEPSPTAHPMAILMALQGATACRGLAWVSIPLEDTAMALQAFPGWVERHRDNPDPLDLGPNFPLTDNHTRRSSMGAGNVLKRLSYSQCSHLLTVNKTNY